MPPVLHGLAAISVCLGASGDAPAQSSSASYQIPRQTIDGGAQRATGATYTLDATIGQLDAGPRTTSTSDELRGGLHRAGAGTGPPDFLVTNAFEAA